MIYPNPKVPELPSLFAIFSDRQAGVKSSLLWWLVFCSTAGIIIKLTRRFADPLNL